MRICVLNMVLKKTKFSQVEFCFDADLLRGGLQCKFTSICVLLWFEKSVYLITILYLNFWFFDLNIYYLEVESLMILQW